MNFINDKELALRFKNKAVPSKERFAYLLVFMAFTPVMYFIGVLYPSEMNQWDLYNRGADIAMTILGTIACYRTNKAGDDKEFIERYVSLTFPITIRMVLVFTIMAVLYVTIDLLFLADRYFDQAVFILSVGILLYFYWRLNSSIRLAAH